METGKVAIVTGGGQGIGRIATEALLTLRYKVRSGEPKVDEQLEPES